MNSRRPRGWGPPGVLIAIGVVVLILALLPLPEWLRVAVFVPLVFLAPGYAAALLLPTRIERGEVVVYIVVLSIAAFALGGLVLQIFVGLDRAAWAVLLISITGLLIAGVILRGESTPGYGRLRLGFSPRRVSVVSVLAFAGAIVIAGVAISVATDGAREQDEQARFSVLWALPGDASQDPGVDGWTIGVENHLGKPSDYILRVTRGRARLGQWRPRLEAGQEWTAHAPASPVKGPNTTVASLYRGGELYRRVELDIGTVR